MLMYMTNKHFMRDIDSRVGEILISHDFKLKKNSWYRHTEDFIQVLNLQKSYFSDLYYLNIGLDVKPDNISSYMPEYICTMGPSINNLEKLIDETIILVEEKGITKENKVLPLNERKIMG